MHGKDGHYFTACDNTRDIWNNIDVIASIAERIVHSPVGKLTCLTNVLFFCVFLGGGGGGGGAGARSNITWL